MIVKDIIRSVFRQPGRVPTAGIGNVGIPRTNLLAYFRNGVYNIGESTVSVYSYICDFAGTEALTLTHLSGSETVVSKIGTSTPTIGSGSISFSTGTMGYLLLSDGTELIFEGSPSIPQSKVYNVDGSGRHGTLVGAAASPFSAPSSEVSYLARFGGSVNPTDGSEVSAILNGNNATNTLTSLGGQTYRFAGDGSSFTYLSYPSVTIGATYRIIPTVITRISGALKGNDQVDSDLLLPFQVTPLPVDDVIQSRINIGRWASGQAIDITVHISVQKVISGVIPSAKNSQNTVLGEAKGFTCWLDIGFPGYVNFQDTAALLACDALLTTPFMFDGVTPRNVTADDLNSFPSGTLENVLFKGQKGLAIYSLVQPPSTARRILAALGANRDLVVGLFADPHFSISNRWNLMRAVNKYRELDVGAFVSLGDTYNGSLQGSWGTLEVMQTDITECEKLFAYKPGSLSKSFSTGNHAYPTYGTFDDFWAESTIATENSVRIFGDVAFINIFNAGTGYVADADALSFLSTELSAAAARGNRIIVQMHVPVKAVSDCPQAAEIRGIIGSAKDSGANVLSVLTAHNHSYDYSVLPDINVPHYIIGDLRDSLAAYVIRIGASDIMIEQISI